VKQKEAKDLADALRESSSSRIETAQILNTSMRQFTGELKSTQKLWKKSGSSILIKAGLALIAFPDPTISDLVGAGLVAAGLIHTKMKNSALHVEDVYKTFPQVIKELGSIRQNAAQQ
jgi:hypothetical protein